MGGNFEEASSASSEEGYQQDLPSAINARRSTNIQTKRAYMSTEGYHEGLPTPVTFADKDLAVSEVDRSSQFTDSFEQSLKSVSDYSDVADGQNTFVSTVSRVCVCVCVCVSKVVASL